jgi:hypothetical protein
MALERPLPVAAGLRARQGDRVDGQQAEGVVAIPQFAESVARGHVGPDPLVGRGLDQLLVPVQLAELIGEVDVMALIAEDRERLGDVSIHLAKVDAHGADQADDEF